MTLQHPKLQTLLKQHPPLDEVHFEKYIDRLNRMRQFYDDKAPDAPLAQGYLFMGFVISLAYAIETITEHRELLLELHKLAGEGKK